MRDLRRAGAMSTDMGGLSDALRHLGAAPYGCDTMTPQAQVERWLDDAIIGLDLCPFAAKVRRADGIRMAFVSVSEPLHAVHATLEEARALLNQSSESPRTTLVVVTAGLGSFETDLDVVATVEEALDEVGAEGILQVASFHPDYRFEGEDEDGVSHFTNRAPFPILHLLREEDVSEAIDRHPDPGGIPSANITKLEAMGAAKVRELWRRWSAAD